MVEIRVVLNSCLQVIGNVVRVIVSLRNSEQHLQIQCMYWICK